MASFFSDPRPQFLDNNGQPLVAGKLYFYQAGTSTPQAIYSDAGLTTPLSNPLTLDGSGRVPNSGIWLQDAHYKLVVKDSAGTEIANVPDFIGSGFGSVSGFSVIDSVNDLRNLTSGEFTFVTVRGYYTNQDGGGGLFYWDDSATNADNSGTTITPNSSPVSGRWRRALSPYSPITPMMFGAIANGTTTVLSNFLAMIDWMDANRQFASLEITQGDYQISGSLPFPSWLNSRVCQGAKFSSNGPSGTVEFAGPTVIESTENVFEYPITGLISYNIGFTDPAWWGVVYGSGSDQSLALTRAVVGTGYNIMRPTNAISINSGSSTISCDMDVSHGAYFALTSPGTLEVSGNLIGSNDTTVFSQATSGLLTISKGQDIRASWFGVVANNSTDNAAALAKLRDSIVGVGGRIIYKGSGVTRISSTYTDPSGNDRNKIEHYIPNGGNVRIYGTAVATMRRIVSGRYSCITIDSGARLSGVVGFIYPEWFGAKGDSLVDDATAITQCSRVAIFGAGTCVDGGGATYYIETAPTIYSGNWQNMTIHSSAGSTLVADISNCRISSVNFAADTALEVKLSSGVKASNLSSDANTYVRCLSQVKITNSYFDNWLIGNSDIFVNGCSGRSIQRTASTAASQVHVFGNEFLTIVDGGWYCDHVGGFLESVTLFDNHTTMGSAVTASTNYTASNEIRTKLLFNHITSGTSATQANTPGWPAGAVIKNAWATNMLNTGGTVAPNIQWTFGGSSVGFTGSGSCCVCIEVY